jgi:hypothetical protein
MNEALDRWLSYRDEIAIVCGITRNGDNPAASAA